MQTVNLEIPENELRIFLDYAKTKGRLLSEVIIETMMEKIEDEDDLKIFEEYEKEKAMGTLVTMPIEELWKELKI